MCLSRTCHTIGKAGHIKTVQYIQDQGLHASHIDLLISDIFWENNLEGERFVFVALSRIIHFGGIIDDLDLNWTVFRFSIHLQCCSGP